MQESQRAAAAGAAMCTDVATFAEAAAANAIGFRVLRCGIAPADQRDAALAKVGDLGFVIVRPNTPAGDHDAAIPRGRHIALVVEGGPARLSAIRWVRALSRASPRGHLVIDLGGCDGSPDAPPENAAAFARDSASADVSAVVHGYPVALSETRRIDRAERLMKRGRHEAAGRWSRASVAAASRRGDEAGMVRIARQTTAGLIGEAALDRALATATRLASEVTTFPAVADAVALEAHVLMLLLEFRRAEALLAGVRTEAALRRADPPPSVESAFRDLYFWCGRFEEARAIARAARPEQAGPSGLAAWACGDRDLFWTCEARLAGGAAAGDLHAAFWQAALAALHGTMFDDESAEDAAAVSIDRVLRAAPSELRPLARAIAAEAHACRGDHVSARAVIEAEPVAGAPLFSLLCDWMRAHGAADRAGRRDVELRVRRAGAHGLTRWGRGGSSMQVLHDWPVLLDLLQGAEDDLAALSGGCAWVRRQSRADAAAIVDADGTSWLAADGWSRADLGRPDVRKAIDAGPGVVAVGEWLLATATVRCHGQPVGRVIARGRPDARVTLERAVHALAAMAGPAVRARLDALSATRAAHALAPEIVGRSPVIVELRETIARAAGTIFPVLIEGESGTGKELVARALHRLSPRRDRRFCGVNCAAFTDELFEAELFGYARGAFTGAVGARAGLIEDAQDGTLFLDEVSDLSARAQAKLLRTLQEREVRRLGENVARSVDVRIVAATNLPLGEAVGQGRFREDLLFRLAVVRIRVPPLRDRPEDIPLLAQTFWRGLESGAGKRVRLGPDALAMLCGHRWPGNVRELQNVLAALVVLAPSRGRVSKRHVEQVLQAERPRVEGTGLSLDAARRQFEQKMITSALARHGGRRASAARELGLSRQGLAKAIRRLALEMRDETVGVA